MSRSPEELSSTSSSSSYVSMDMDDGGVLASGTVLQNTTQTDLPLAKTILGHLDDMESFIEHILSRLRHGVDPCPNWQSLLESFSDDNTVTVSSTSNSSNSTSNCINSSNCTNSHTQEWENPSTEQLMVNLLKKDKVLQKCVDQLVERASIQMAIEYAEKEIREVDGKISRFVQELGRLEHTLLQNVCTPGSESPLRGLDDAEMMENPSRYTVHQLMVLAERLSITSCPPEFVESAGMSVQKPPAPMEELMAHSSLHKSVQELLQSCSSSHLVPVVSAQAAVGTTDSQTLLEKYIDQEQGDGDSDEDSGGDLSNDMLEQLWKELR